MVALSLAFTEYNFIADSGFHPVPHEYDPDNESPGVSMRVTFNADRGNLGNERTGVAKSCTKAALWERGVLRITNAVSVGSATALARMKMHFRGPAAFARHATAQWRPSGSP